MIDRELSDIVRMAKAIKGFVERNGHAPLWATNDLIERIEKYVENKPEGQ